MRALRLVVAVEFLQVVVEQACKLIQILRLACKLDEPLVAAVSVLVHEHRSCRVFAHLCTRLLAGIGKSALGVVHDELFAKRIDEVLRAAGDDELIGILLREHHGVADHVAPQAARRGDHHRIVLVGLYAPEGNHFGVRGVERNKLVEHIVVEHEHHRCVGKVVLQSEETLTGVVGLHVVHLR